MNVNMNGLRMQLALSFDKVCRKLNQHIESDGTISITTEDLQDAMDELRVNCCLPCHISIDGDENFKPLSEWIDKQNIEWFNPCEIGINH